jgi:hypothetical protein
LCKSIPRPLIATGKDIASGGGTGASAMYGSAVQANTNENQVVGREISENELVLRAVVPVLSLNRKHAGTVLLDRDRYLCEE